MLIILYLWSRKNLQLGDQQNELSNSFIKWRFRKYAADTFTEDLHKDLKADFILANPPFNLEWDVDKVSKDPRWRYGLAPKNNANYAWLQHMISKLSQNGKMACILANGSLSAGGQEGEIRKKIIENDLVDCIISMPTNLFYTVTVPCSIWIINRNKKQKGKTLFINANNLGIWLQRRLREYQKKILRKQRNVLQLSNDENYENINGLFLCFFKQLKMII